MVLIIQGCYFIRSLHFSFELQRRLCAEFKAVSSILLQLSGRLVIPSEHSTVQALSVRTTRTFSPDLPLYQEASNCSKLHPSKRLSSTSERRSVFDQLGNSFQKHKFGKTVATVRTMCIPVWTRSFIRQVVHSKFNRPDNSLHGPDAQASYMEIVCIRSTIRMTAIMFRMCQALIWKLLAAKVQPSGRKGNTVWTQLNSRKNFSEFGKPIAQLSARTPYVYRPDSA
jgi:hypothetical protein